mgnify:CR=1 FL=1
MARLCVSYVMSRVNSQLLKVMSILDEQAKLNPKDADIQLRLELFTDCPDHAPLLNKLEQEYKVINILQRPDERGFGRPDHGMFEMEQPKSYDRYMSYFISLKPTFDKIYIAEYLKHRSTTATLTDNNRTLVISVMHAIDDEVSLVGKTELALKFKESDEQVAKALGFLKKVGAVEDFEAVEEYYYDDDYARELPSGIIEYFAIRLNVRRFDEVLTELDGNDTQEQVADSEPEPQEEKAAATPEQERLILFMAVIGKAFGDNDQKPIRLPLAAFKPLSFKQVNEFIDQYDDSKTFIVRGRPKTATDKTPYELELTEYQKTAFNELKNNLGHLRDMQMLMIYWGKMCETYDAVLGGYVGFEDGQLNRSYLLLTIRIDKILAKDEFAELQKEKPFIYDSFMGNMEDLDMSYEFMRPELWGFYGKLERLWVEKADGVGVFKLEEDEQRILDDADKAIAEHKERKAHLNANFEKRLEKVATNAKAEETAKNDSQSKDKGSVPPKDTANQAAAKVDIQPLQPSSYHDKTGKLNVSAGVDVSIAVRGKVTRKNRTKYDQCHLMGCLFKSVNTLNNGITFSKFLGVKYNKSAKTHIRKIRNTVDEINKKVADKTTAKKLIFIQGEKIFVNSSYLKK